MKTLLLPFIFAIGVAFGSFLSMLIPRIHDAEAGILFGRSHCPKCKGKLKSRDLIPILSYCWNQAKCRFCSKKISPIYPAIEVLTGIMFILVYLRFPFESFAASPLAIFYGIITLILIFTFFYDLKYLEISDSILLPGTVIAFLGSLFLGIHTWQSLLLGMGIGVGFFLLQLLISRGKWIGAGDLRIGAFMGAVLGWEMTLVALVLSYLAGSALSIPLLLAKAKKVGEKIPLGPFLVIGTFLALFFGEQLLDWYINLSL